MSNIAIKVEDLSKAYQLGEIGTGTISRDLERWFARIRGKEDPFLRIGETNDRTTAGSSNIVWSLKNINFEIEQGDAVGIIGRNGAGKSTLLKILSKVTSPTTGKITGKGRIASLLEVGTGFHPELTGRENIFLNGAILGMRKAEIRKHFDAIVDFAGIERYVDTPVKRYSSGMYVRLAFAVAAHLESEILIVDEVLAVGDAEFQKKCLGKMGEVSRGEGRTILFVSHNMGAIQALCKKAICLQQGRLEIFADTLTAIKKYQESYLFNNECFWVNEIDEFNKIRLDKIDILDGSGRLRNSFTNNEEVIIRFHLLANDTVEHIKVGFDLIKDGAVAFRTQHSDTTTLTEFKKGKYTVDCFIPARLLNLGEYSISPLLSKHMVESYTKVAEPILAFSISLDTNLSLYHVSMNQQNHIGVTFPQLIWSLKEDDISSS